MEDKITLEKKFEELESLLKKLEDEKLPLQDAFTLYAEGIELVKQCNTEIGLVEKKVLELKDNGQTTEFIPKVKGNANGAS